MGRAPCCSKVGLHRGPWTPREDTLLTKYIEAHGEGNWRSMPKEAGLLRCGKSCRLRWMNYLRPDIKRGNITPDEDDLIVKLHTLLGNRWSLIAGRLPGRTDNEIKNYWNTHLSKKFNTVRVQNLKKKRKNNPNANKKQKNKIKKEKLENEKIKIHQPKPVRVSTSFSVLPRSESFESSSSRSSHGSDYQQQNGHNNIGANNNFNGVKFFIRDDENDNDDQDHDNNTLDKLYDEYLQLLNTEENQVMLNSFAESLLI